MITSDRTFGVEIEFFAPTRETLQNISRQIPVVEDGSLRDSGIPFGGEYVSDVLRGKRGVAEIKNACRVLKENSVNCEPNIASVHTHLGLRTPEVRTVRASRNRTSIPDDQPVLAISNAVIIEYCDSIGSSPRRLVETIRQNLQNDGVDGWASQDHLGVGVWLDNVYYNSITERKKHPRTDARFFQYLWVDEPVVEGGKLSRFEHLKNIFHFYTLYSDVMENIVPNSRRMGNMYCIPLGQSYDLKDIESCTTEEGLKRVWYKNRGSNGRYDDSRYHNVNLHAAWYRHNTIEIRSHGGTIDPDKILLWVKLHQYIIDKLEVTPYEHLKLISPDVNASFVEFIEDPLLKSYVKRLLGYYSNIKI